MTRQPAPALRVLVADDQRIVRDGLVALLGTVAGIDVVAAAENGAEALRLAASHRPDAVLMDLRMPEIDGVEATRRLTSAFPEMAVVVLTTFDDDESIIGALRAGARGYLTKNAGRAEIARALHSAVAKQTTLDPAAHATLLDAATRAYGVDAPARAIPDDTPARHDTLPDGLTDREGEVLRLIAAGLSNPEIAKRLFIGETTVKTHINHIFAKIGVRDRAQAVGYAHRHGLAD
jgi:DNA-binding NarL/FixJ family response regulator